MEGSRPKDHCPHGNPPAEPRDHATGGQCCSNADTARPEDRVAAVIGDISYVENPGDVSSTTPPCKDSGCCGGSSPIGSDKCNEEDSGGGKTDSDIGCEDGCCTVNQQNLSKTDDDGRVAQASKSDSCEEIHEDKVKCEDACCATDMAIDSTASSDCEAECCKSTSKSPAERLSDSLCCDEKPGPCCDEDCLERAIQRECNACGKLPSPSDHISCDEQNEDHAQKHHVCTVREFYAKRLKSFGCLCRTLIAQGKQSCCVSSARSSLYRGVRSGRVTKRSSARSYSSSSVSTADKSHCQTGCCTETEPTIAAIKNEAFAPRNTKKAVKDAVTGTDLIDVESGPMKDSEHVILTISGMTCTGCEVKLQRTLAQIKHLHNIKASLVLSRAEFDLETGKGTVDDVIQRLIQATGFKVERISSSGAQLDVIPYGDMQQFLDQDLPLGVYELRKIDKQVARVQFDPVAIGPRDVIAGDLFEYRARLAPLRPDASISAGRKHVFYLGSMTLLSIVLTIPVLVMAWAPITPRPIPYGAVSLALGTIVQFVVAGPFYPQAIKSLFLLGVIEMDLLIVLSTSAAYIFSVTAFGYLVAGKELSTGEFFETSTLLVTLIMVGRFVSALARQKAIESISLRSLQAPRAILVDETGGDATDIDARLLQFGDFFLVMPDSRVPTDGTVISGISEVDESMLTGESTPVPKSAKSSVVAGSMNGSGTLIVRLTRLPGDNTITSIAAMIDEAKLSKPRIQAVADRVASVFVPVMIGLATIVFVIWLAIGMKIRLYSGSEAAINAITYAITVLIVSCPCAIGLAVPMVVVIASGVAAKRGFIFKSAETIEIAYKTTHVVFDKTGTLTEGKLTVSSEEYTDDAMERETISGILVGLVSNVKHPVSIAVATTLKDRGVAPVPIKDVTAVSGKGVEGVWNGKTVRAGNARWLAQEQHPAVQKLHAEGNTTLVLQIGSSTSAIVGLRDVCRPSAAVVVPALQARGIQVALLSGDNEGATSNVAATLGITDYRALCTPADKQAYMRGIIDQDPRAMTMFVGDGTNDAPALAQAMIGVHIRERGTDVAASAADAILVHPDLTGILRLIALSHAAMRRIAFNFAWSFIYNVLALLLASGALVVARIPPQFGGLGELVSVLPVIAIALQLRWSGSAKPSPAPQT